MDTTKGKIAIYQDESAVEQNLANANLQSELLRADTAMNTHILEIAA